MTIKKTNLSGVAIYI